LYEYDTSAEKIFTVMLTRKDCVRIFEQLGAVYKKRPHKIAKNSPSVRGDTPWISKKI